MDGSITPVSLQIEMFAQAVAITLLAASAEFEVDNANVQFLFSVD